MKKFRELMTDGRLAVLIIIAILVIDQIIKIAVKTNMTLGESIRITDWFYINFVENEGMAYGMSFIYKPLLTLFRVFASVLIGVYLHRQIKAKARTSYVLLLAMFLAGALGNAIDCMFYGLIFSGASHYYVSYFVPFGTGYGSFLTGKVVDMFYFPLVVTTWPDWVPVVGGNEFIFFSPVFNFADACISVSVVALLIFCRRELSVLTSSHHHEE